MPHIDGRRKTEHHLPIFGVMSGVDCCAYGRATCDSVSANRTEHGSRPLTAPYALLADGHRKAIASTYSSTRKMFYAFTAKRRYTGQGYSGAMAIGSVVNGSDRHGSRRPASSG